MAYNNTISILISAKDEASAALKATAASVGDSAKQMEAFGQKASAVGSTLTKTVTLPIVGVAAAAVKMAADFQSSMTRLVTSAGESESNLSMVSAGVLQVARDTGTSTTQLAQAMYMVESGGQHGAAGLTVLKAAAQGAKTENADLTTVADAVTSAMTDYHLKADQAANVTSKLVAATGQGKTTFQDLAGAMSAILPKASAAHISLDEILGDLASMTLHGISSQQASENLADALSHLQSPTQAMSKEMAALGLNSTELSQNLGTVGLTGTIQKIAHAIQSDMGPQSTGVILNMQNALKGLPQSVQNVSQQVIDGTASWTDWNKSTKNLTVTQKAQAQAFATLFNGMHTIGTEQMSGAQVMQTYAGAMNKAMGDSAGLNVALMLTGENTDNTTKSIQAVTGATADASGNVQGWSDVQSTFNFHLAQFKETLQTSAIVLGNDLLPPLTTFIDKIDSAANWFEHLNPAQRKFLEQVAGYTAIIGPSVLILGKFASGLSSIIGLSKSVVGAFTRIAVAAGGVSKVGMLTGLSTEGGLATEALAGGGGLLAAIAPVAAGIAALGLVAGGAYLLFKHFSDAGKETTSTLNTQTSPAVQKFRDTAKELGVTLKGTGSQVGLLTLAQDVQTTSVTMVTKAQAQVIQSSKDYKVAQQNLTVAHTNLSTAQDAVKTALDKFGANSPQYQTAVDNLARVQNYYDQQLAATASDSLAVITNGGKLRDAEAVWAGSTTDLANTQAYLNGLLGQGVGVIGQFGPMSINQVTAVDTLQVHLSGVVTSWNNLHTSIQTQATLDANVFQGMQNSIAVTQGQSDSLNQSLGSASSTANSLFQTVSNIQASQTSPSGHVSVNAGGGGGGGSLKVVGHALGTNYSAGGLTLLGEQGPEYVNLPRGSQVVPSNKTQQMQGGSEVHNHFDGTFTFNNQGSVDAFFKRVDQTMRLAKMGMA